MPPGAMAASPFTTSPIPRNRVSSRTSTCRRPSPAARTRRCRCPDATSRSCSTSSTAEHCVKGISRVWVVDVRARENPVPIATLPTPTGRDFCDFGNFGPHNLHENRPGSFQSEDHGLRDLAQCRRARVRHCRSVRAARARVLDPAGPHAHPRPAARDRAVAGLLRRLCAAGRAHVPLRLECRRAHPAIRGVIPPDHSDPAPTAISRCTMLVRFQV